MVAAARYLRRPRFEEDRPPVIVRGGSLIFQSGDEITSRKGSPWTQVQEGTWTPHQPHGRPAMHMVLTVEAEHGCDVSRKAVTDIRIRYFGTDSLESFQITTADGHGPVRIPLVVGAGLTERSDASEYPAIERHGAGNTFSLSYRPLEGGIQDCSRLTKATIEFFD